jgi:hypothetical protein
MLISKYIRNRNNPMEWVQITTFLKRGKEIINILQNKIFKWSTGISKNIQHD